MQNNFKLLFVGDVFAKGGRKIITEMLPALKSKYDVDFVIINGENLAGGSGITHATVKEMFDAGVDCITSGNHIWRQYDAFSILEEESRVLRPANYPHSLPGNEYFIFSKNGYKIAVFNLLGRVFMDPINSPFEKADQILEEVSDKSDFIVCDFHAETTSEKVAMGWYLNGRVTAVFGTHTHIQTADERILDKGTAYITDAGMTGSYDSVIGVETEIILKRLVEYRNERFKPAKNNLWLSAVLTEFDKNTKKAVSIERIQIREVDKNGFFVKG